MKFKKEILQELAECSPNEEFDGFTCLVNDIDGNSRWSIEYRLIFKYDERCYSIYYRRGATENQDEQPFEYDNNEIECTEVEPYEKVITEYRVKK